MSINRLIEGRYITPAPTVVSGQNYPIRVGVDGVLLVASSGSLTVVDATPLTYNTTVLAKEGTIYGSADGILIDVNVYNDNAAIRWLMVWDAAAAPGAVVPDVVPLMVPPKGNASITFGAGKGLNAFTATGIYWTCSSTAATHTISATNDFLVNAQYRT